MRPEQLYSSWPALWYDQFGQGSIGISLPGRLLRGIQLKTAGTPALSRGVAMNILSEVSSIPVTNVFSGLEKLNILIKIISVEADYIKYLR